MVKVIFTNRKAYHKYIILETYEAGLVLKGSEVKSLREGKVGLQDSFVQNKSQELFLQNFYIVPYSHSSTFFPERHRLKKLLLKKQEINRIIGKLTQHNLTAVPLEIYFNDRGIAKVKIGLVKSKKLVDKRNYLRQKDIDREVQRELKQKL